MFFVLLIRITEFSFSYDVNRRDPRNVNLLAVQSTDRAAGLKDVFDSVAMGALDSIKIKDV